LNTARPIQFGLLAFGALLAAYFGVLAAISGWQYTVKQFLDTWYYIVPLALGFGLQVALYVRLRQLLIGTKGANRVVAASGTTSSVAMLSCCAHYIVNVAPVLGATGLVSFAAQYQVAFFWVGFAFNAAGIAFIGSRLWKATKDHAQCAHA
jgi:Cu+-exporting ATPase